MRGNILAVSAGIVAALCFSSVFFHLVLGQLFFPLNTLPLFLVLLTLPFRDIWLSLAASGATLALFGITGLFGPEALVGVLISFAVLAAIPAVLVGGIYATPLKREDPETGEAKWVPAEVALIVLTALGLILFYVAYFSAETATGQPLYNLFYDIVLPFATTASEQFHQMNPQIAADVRTPAEVAVSLTKQLSGFMVLMFVLGQFMNLLFAQWLLRRNQLTEMPMPQIGSLYFPFTFVVLLFAAAGLFAYGQAHQWSDATLFALTPLLTAAGLPVMVQGLSLLHRYMVKNLVKVGMISVYLALAFSFIFLQLPTCFVLAIIGTCNSLWVLLKKNKG